MLRKDYLIKQIEEFGRALAIIHSHKREQNYEAYEQETAMVFKKFSEKDLSEVEYLIMSEFESEIVLDNTLDLPKKKIIAHLLFEKMNYYIEKGDLNSALHLKAKCLLLYEFILNNLTDNEYDLDVHYKLSYLKS